jgi:hypothetical protein
MEIIRLEGEDQRLYYLVAHLVMNEEVLKYNLNYPYKTSPDYYWFVAVEGDNVLGFIPVELKEGKATINNYYVANDDHEVFSILLKEVVLELQPDFEIESVTQMRHISNFERNNFSIVYYWKRYVKMKVFGNGKERL